MKRVLAIFCLTICVCVLLGCSNGGLVATVSNSTGKDIRLVSVGTAEPKENLPLEIPSGKSTTLHFSNFPDGFYFEVEYEGRIYRGDSGMLDGSLGHKGNASVDIFLKDDKLSSSGGQLKEKAEQQP